MKKVFCVVIIIFLMILCISMFTNSNKLNNGNKQTETTYTPEKPIVAEQRDTNESKKIIKISSDEYFDIVYNAIKNNVESKGFIISRVSTLRTPYYSVDCISTNIDATTFKEEALKIAENIYNILIEYKYKRPNIFVSSHEIISLSFQSVVNGETANGMTIQFDITDIDKTKPFLENLKTPITT